MLTHQTANATRFPPRRHALPRLWVRWFVLFSNYRRRNNTRWPIDRRCLLHPVMDGCETQKFYHSQSCNQFDNENANVMCNQNSQRQWNTLNVSYVGHVSMHRITTVVFGLYIPHFDISGCRLMRANRLAKGNCEGWDRA